MKNIIDKALLGGWKPCDTEIKDFTVDENNLVNFEDVHGGIHQWMMVTLLNSPAFISALDRGIELKS